MRDFNCSDHPVMSAMTSIPRELFSSLDVPFYFVRDGRLWLAKMCSKSLHEALRCFYAPKCFPKNVQTVAICIDRRSRPMPSPRIRKTASRCDLSFKRERFRQMLFVKCRRKRVTQSRSAREVTLKPCCAKNPQYRPL